MIGGQVKERDLVLKNAWQIDENLVYDELASMKTGRFGTPTANLNDKFILVAGGQIGKNKFTNLCEIYDVQTNKWVPIDSLKFARGNTSMCPVTNRYVFIFQGLAPSSAPSTNNAIEYIDFGNFDAPSVRSAKWETITVQNQEFISSEPRGCS
jgi:hypothetical protein